MLNRWIEAELLDVLGDEGVGCIVFSPLAQGLLTDRYLDGVPEGSRASQAGSLNRHAEPGQPGQGPGPGRHSRPPGPNTFAAGAVVGAARQRVTSALIGVSSLAQLEANVEALQRLEFTADELAEIDRYATEGNLNIWARSSSDG